MLKWYVQFGPHSESIKIVDVEVPRILDINVTALAAHKALGNVDSLRLLMGGLLELLHFVESQSHLLGVGAEAGGLVMQRVKILEDTIGTLEAQVNNLLAAGWLTMGPAAFSRTVATDNSSSGVQTARKRTALFTATLFLPNPGPATEDDD